MTPALRSLPDWGEMSAKTAIRKVLPLVGRRIVDIGCGNGALAAWLRREGACVVGVEPEAALLLAARGGGDGRQLAGCAERLPLKSGCADVAIFFNSLHHVQPPGQVAALAEALRIVRRGGDLLIIEPEAAGSYFELLQPLDDETLVRAAAERAIQAVIGRLGVAVASGRFATTLGFADAATVIDAFTRADAARAALVETVRPLVEQRFAALGEPSADGRRQFVQPMRLHHLRAAPA